MTFHAENHGNPGCTSCGGGNGFELAYKTPAEYARHARRLAAQGSPKAPRAAKAAMLAYGVARAKQLGRTDLVAQGLHGLRALSDPPVTLDRDAIQAKFRDLVERQVAANREVLRTASAIVGLVMVPLQAAGQAIGNLSDRATYMTVLQVIDFAVASASGSTSASLPTMGTDAITGLVTFCGVWNGGVKTLVQTGVNAAARAYEIRDRSGAAAISTLGGIVVGILDGLCADPQIRSAQAASQAAMPGDCMTLVCPSGQVPRARTDGTGCDCGAPTDISPLAAARRSWTAAMTARKLVEGVLTLPSSSPTLRANAEAINCRSSCTLFYWEQRYLAAKVAAGQPAVLETHVRTPTSSTPRRFIDSRTNPRCDCLGIELTVRDNPGDVYDGEGGGGGGGGGGAGVAVAGAAAVAALFFFMKG